MTILRELDLGQHTLFVMNDGSIDLVANDEQTVYLADNVLHLDGDEAYRLLVALYEQFKGKPADSYEKGKLQRCHQHRGHARL